MSSYPYSPTPQQGQPTPQPWSMTPQAPPPAMYAPDYGPFGTVPTMPGVVHFGENWSTRNKAAIFLGLGALLFLMLRSMASSKEILLPLLS